MFYSWFEIQKSLIFVTAGSKSWRTVTSQKALICVPSLRGGGVLLLRASHAVGASDYTPSPLQRWIKTTMPKLIRPCKSVVMFDQNEERRQLYPALIETTSLDRNLLIFLHKKKISAMETHLVFHLSPLFLFYSSLSVLFLPASLCDLYSAIHSLYYFPPRLPQHQLGAKTRAGERERGT